MNVPDWELHNLFVQKWRMLQIVGNLLAYKEAGVKEYKLLTTLDFKTSEICRELDGNVYLVSQAERGVNYPTISP